MSASESIYFGALIDWHNYPTGGLNGQSGFTTYAGSALAQFNTNLGKRSSLSHISGTPSKWGNGTATGGTPNTNPFSALQSVLNAAHAAGALPFVDWSPWDWALPTSNFALRPAAIAAGNWDSYITQWMTDAKTWGKAILIRPFWEMNASGQFPWSFSSAGTWTIPAGNGWGGTWTNSIADVLNAWAKIRSIRDSVGALNVQMAYVANRHASAETATTFALIFPPMSQVDWLGVDNYPDHPTNTLGNAVTGTGTETYLTNNYADLAALDPVKPIIIGETAFRGTSGETPVNVTSITSNGTAWTITVPAGTWTWTGGGNTIALSGVTPTAYNGDWTIDAVTGAGPFTITHNTATNPGTATVTGQARFIDRVSRAAAITTSLETDLPAMPRVKAIAFYWVMNGWGDKDSFPLDVDGTQTARIDFVAFKNGIGNAHYLAGQQLAADTSAFPWIPFQDQVVTADTSTGRPTAQERYLDVRRSLTGLKLLLPLTEANGAASMADVSGLGRNGTPVGNPGLGAAGSVPALPNWTAPSFPGASGNYIQVADNPDWSPNGVSKAIWTEFGVFIPGTWTPGSFAAVSKYGAAAAREFIFGFYSGNPGLAVAVYDGTNLITSFNLHSWPTTDVPHHFVALYDPSLATNQFKVWIDGAAALVGGGTPTANTVPDTATPLMIGQNLDTALLWPTPAGVRILPVAFGTGILTDESAAELHASWIAAPAVSALAASGITANAATLGFTTDVGGSTEVEYGSTTAYGQQTTYDPQRLTAHSVALSGLASGATVHWRARSRNQAGTEALSTDQTFNTTTLITLTGIAVSSVWSSGATITWTTSVAASSQLDYGLTTAYGTTAPESTPLVLNHAYSLSGLTPNTTYHVRARSYDASRNSVVSGDISFTTSPAPVPALRSDLVRRRWPRHEHAHNQALRTTRPRS